MIKGAPTEKGRTPYKSSTGQQVKRNLKYKGAETRSRYKKRERDGRETDKKENANERPKQNGVRRLRWSESVCVCVYERGLKWAVPEQSEGEG